MPPRPFVAVVVIGWLAAIGMLLADRWLPWLRPSEEPPFVVDLSDEVFATEVKEHLFYEVVKAQLASKRQGTAAAKNRSAVSGSTKKLYKQKGTGRARHGSIRAPIFVGGVLRLYSTQNPCRGNVTATPTNPHGAYDSRSSQTAPGSSFQCSTEPPG